MNASNRFFLCLLTAGFAVTGVGQALRLSAPADEGMFPFAIRPDAAGSVADMSAWVPAPAGRNGFLRREGEHFVDGHGNVVRLNGVNLTGGGCFPKRAEADRLSAQFARLGLNCVRLHLFDQFEYGNCFQDVQPCLMRRDASGKASVVDEVMRDRFEYLIAALAKRGVHVNVNLHAGHQFGPADGVRKTCWANRGVDFFDRTIIEADKAFFRDLLRHVNPHTGRTLADDPAVALMEINNENALMQVYWSETLQNQKADPWYLEEFHRLREKAGYAATTNGINRFIVDTEKRYFREMSAFLKRDLGVKCPVYGTQLDYTAPWVLSETCDATDMHIYWTHPEWMVPKGVDPRRGRTAGVPWHFVNKPLVAAGLAGGWDIENQIVRRGGNRVAGLPFITSECAAPYPNWYGADFQPMIHAYAAFQDWAGVFAYSWANESNVSPAHNPFFFSYAARPDCVAHFPACSALFLRGDVAKAKRRIDVPVDAEALYEKAQEELRLLWVVQPELASGGKVSNAVFLRHGLAVAFPREATFDVPAVPCATDGTIVSDTGELTFCRDAGTKGYFAVNTANVKVLSGFTDGRRFDLGGVVFEPGCTKLGWSTISLLSQNADGFGPGARLLLAATGFTHNGGAVFRHERGDSWGGKTEDLGDGKVITEGIPLRVALPGAVKGCWALDENGARREPVPVRGRVIDVGPACRTVWYEIVME